MWAGTPTRRSTRSTGAPTSAGPATRATSPSPGTRRWPAARPSTPRGPRPRPRRSSSIPPTGPPRPSPARRAGCRPLSAQGPRPGAPPVIVYPHNGAGGAVVGGVFYTGTTYPPEYQGQYFYGDYAIDFIHHAVINGQTLVGADMPF